MAMTEKCHDERASDKLTFPKATAGVSASTEKQKVLRSRLNNEFSQFFLVIEHELPIGHRFKSIGP